MVSVKFYDSVEDSLLKLRSLSQKLMENGCSVNIKKEIHLNLQVVIEKKTKQFLKRQVEN